MEPDTTGAADEVEGFDFDDVDVDEPANINVTTSQFGGDDGAQEDEKQNETQEPANITGNEDLNVNEEQVRPKTAPQAAAGAGDDDWPTTNKAEQIAALSQKMKNLTQVTDASRMIG